MNNHHDLLHRHVALFNQGVRTGDFGPMLVHFTDDADLIFAGIPVGPFHGKAAVAAAYQAQPPDDEIDVLETRQEGEALVAVYAWRGVPQQPAGTMILTPKGEQIGRLVVIYGAPGAL